MEIVNKQWELAMKSRAFNKKQIAFDTKSGDYRRSIRSQHEIARKAITFDKKSIASKITENRQEVNMKSRGTY